MLNTGITSTMNVTQGSRASLEEEVVFYSHEKLKSSDLRYKQNKHYSTILHVIVQTSEEKENRW